MNCQEALSLLYEIIDKEASEIDTQQVQEHLSKCRHCSEIYRVEKSVNDLIRAKLQVEESSPKLETLKTKVLDQLDAIDINMQNGSPIEPESGSENAGSKRFFRFGRYFAIAAAVVIAVGAIYYSTRPSRNHPEIFIPLEQAHIHAADNPDIYINMAATMSIMKALDNQMDYIVSPEVGNFAMVGGTMEEVNGQRIAHFVYHNADRIVSVFIGDEHLLTIPPEALDAAVQHNGMTFFDHRCRGCRLVYHQTGNVVVVTATRANDVELLDFVPGHRVI